MTSAPLGIATYKTLKAIPKPYRSLVPVIEGVRRELANGPKEKRAKKKMRRTRGPAGRGVLALLRRFQPPHGSPSATLIGLSGALCVP